MRAVPEPLRSYLIAIPVLAAAAIAVTAADTRWQARQALIFAGLLSCAAIAATRPAREPPGAPPRDLQSIWYLAIAVVLAPFFAFAAPIPLTAYNSFGARPVAPYARVFGSAATSLAYGCASLLFHAIPPSVAGAHPGTGRHALTWTATAAVCGLAARGIRHLLLFPATRPSTPAAAAGELERRRESVIAVLVELSLAVSVTLVVAIDPELMVLAVPLAVLQRRYLLRDPMSSHARIDAQTGLMNAATWQREATAELLRPVRPGTPATIALAEIDHFEDTSGGAGQVRDQLLRDVADMLAAQLREDDLIGRFGGEEFAILLPRTGQGEARRISERLRGRIAGAPIVIESGDRAGFVFRLTVSIGIAGLTESRHTLAELIGAAGTALSRARGIGGNRVQAISDAAIDPASRETGEQGPVNFPWPT